MFSPAMVCSKDKDKDKEQKVLNREEILPKVTSDNQAKNLIPRKF